MMGIKDEFVTIKEVAEIMHVCRPTALFILEKQGVAPVEIGTGRKRKHRRWLKSVIEDVIQTLQRQAQAQHKKTQKPAKTGTISVCDLSAEDLWQLTQMRSVQ